MKIVSFIITLFAINSWAFEYNSEDLVALDTISYSRVIAYEYRWEKGSSYDVPPFWATSKKIELNHEQQRELDEILEGNHVLSKNKSWSACFQPRHALIFYDKSKSHRSVHICLSCNNLAVDHGPTQELTDKIKLINYLKKIGLPLKENSEQANQKI